MASFGIVCCSEVALSYVDGMSVVPNCGCTLGIPSVGGARFMCTGSQSRSGEGSEAVGITTRCPLLHTSYHFRPQSDPSHPRWTGLRHLWSNQDLTTQSCHGMVDMPHGMTFLFFSFLFFQTPDRPPDTTRAACFYTCLEGCQSSSPW